MRAAGRVESSNRFRLGRRLLALPALLLLATWMAPGAVNAQSGSVHVRIHLPPTLVLEVGPTVPAARSWSPALVGLESRAGRGALPDIRLGWIGEPGSVRVSETDDGLLTIESI